jgi:hypothetical protein
MSKFNRSVAVVTASPVQSEKTPSGVTYEGAPGYARDAKSELFLLAVSLMGMDGSFYEKAKDREDRYTSLVRAVAAEDPEWMAKFIPWLRDSAAMRTASVVAAAEALKALQDAGKPGGRQIVASALRRADEPGELLAYWRSRYGRKLPVALNRGIADAVKRLYTEFALLKYDSREASLRFGDVVELVNPRYHLREYGTWRDAIYRYAIELRHGRGNEVPESLPTIRANIALRKAAAEDPRVLLDADALKAAGMTWEDVLSLAGPKVSKRELWTALIPSMGAMALVRNLRNFDEAKVPDDVAQQVAERISDPETVRKSRQFPFRYLAAYKAAPSLRWAYPLEQALNASLANVPELPGRTLILVDRSGSMFGSVSERSGLNRADSAALFGTALALRAEHADVIEFGTSSQRVGVERGGSVLRAVEKFGNLGGTNTVDAVRRWFRDGFHSRVVIITDEQAWGGFYGGNPLSAIPDSVPSYTWNLAGEKYGHGPSGTGQRHAFGGLTDHAFRMIPMLEAGRDARWDDLFGTSAE